MPAASPRTRITPAEAPAAQPGTGLSVKLEQLRAFYGDAEQVKGVDLEFKANQVTAIIGPSGLKVISGAVSKT